MSTKQIVGVLSLLGLVGICLFGWVRRDLWEEAAWSWTGSWSLNEAQHEQIQGCASLDWITTVRFIEQDIDDSCPFSWLPTQAVGLLNEKRITWLAERTKEAFSLRTRIRAHLILEHADQRSPGLPMVLDQMYSETDAALLEWFGGGEELPEWVQPMMRHRMEVDRWSNGFDNARGGWIAEMKWLKIRHPLSVNESYRERLFELAADHLGLDVGRFGPEHEIRKQGGTFPSTKPPEWCSDSIHVACLFWLAEQVEQGGVGEWPGDGVAGPSKSIDFGYITSMLSLRYQDDPALSRLTVDVLKTYREWFDGLHPDVREAVQAYWLGKRAAPFGPTGQKMLSDLEPVHRILLGATSPWFAVLLWRTYSHGATQSFKVVSQDGVHYARFGTELFRIDSCELVPIEDETVFKDSQDIPLSSVAAYAALEWAAHLFAMGLHMEGRQMVQLVKQFDPKIGGEAQHRVEGSEWIAAPSGLKGVLEPLLSAPNPLQSPRELNPLPSPTEYQSCMTSLFFTKSGA